MKDKLLAPFKDVLFWVDLFVIYVSAAVMIFFNVKWYMMLIYAFIAAIITGVFFCKAKIKNREFDALCKKINMSVKLAQKTGDSSQVYKVLNEEVIPMVRNNLPKKIYKYYRLDDNVENNSRRLANVKSNLIWSSIYSEFNDPFECQYMYLTENDLEEIGFPKESKKIWDSIIEQLRQRITTICFTQNPNDMPMWAHYANEHKGFCIEYEVVDAKNLYPVLYVKNRMKAISLFVELFYVVFNEYADLEERKNAFKFVMLLSAFKEESWKAENEIRAVFMNSKEDMMSTGKLCSCQEIGVRPTKIYIGVKCVKEHSDKLITIAKDMDIPYEKCELSTGEKYSVLQTEVE